MSGPLGSQQWMYASGGFYPYEVDQSLRFNDDDTAYLSRTPSTAGNRKTWTWSGWVKFLPLANYAPLIEGFTGASDTYSQIGIVSSGFQYTQDNGSGGVAIVKTNAVFRDPSAWYHVVFSIDTTQATSTNRVKIYVNGVEQTTTFTTTPSQNLDTWINGANGHRIGARWNVSYERYDGYLAEVNLIDGQALDATSFGEFKSGVWIPKEYEGTYGTNGFYLDFGNSGSLGSDSSGNGNNWTPTNLASTDQMLDSPTNNFATLNSVHVGTGLLYEGNLRHASAYGYGYVYGKSTIAIPETGKWVFEGYFLVTPTVNNYNSIGVTSNPNLAGAPFNVSGNYGINDAYSFGQSFVQNGTRQGSIGVSEFTHIQVLVDRDNNQMTFVRNGVLQTGTGSTVAIPSSGLLFPVIGEYVTTQVINFGQDSSFGGEVTAQGNTDANGIGDFYYAPPADYLALCTANLPNPAIDPAQDDVPADYFNTVLYTGTGAAQSITGVGYQPDLVWLKSRSSAFSHFLVDGVRGNTKYLTSNVTDAEYTATNRLTSFDSDGFTLGNAGGSVNGSGESIVAWNWLAGNGTSSNTDGTITSTVSANQKAGFSIVTYTGNTTAGATVGHGLGSAPDMIIIRDRDTVDNWAVYHSSLGGGNASLFLESTTAVNTSLNMWNSTAPSSSVITLGNRDEVNRATAHVAYCFAEVEGFSKFGSYTGNGSTNGPFVYTGFRPAFVLWKNIASGENWHILGTVRDDHNVADHLLYPNLSNAESFLNDGQGIDFLSNGFKPKVAGGNWINASGATFIYMAFAEMPFKYANAR